MSTTVESEDPSPLKLALVGGGRRSLSIMALLDNSQLKRLNLEIIGLADIDPRAEGLVAAQKRGIFTTADYHDLLELPGLGLIVDLTGREEVLEDLARCKPVSVGLLDRVASIHFHGAASLGLELEQTVDLERSLARTLTAASSDGVMVLDADYRILRINQAACRWADISSEQAPGSFCFQVLHNALTPCKSPETPCPMRESLATGRPAHCIHEFRDSDGTPHFCDVTTYPLKRQGEQVDQVLEIFRDITEQLGSRMEQRAKAIKKDLARLVQEDKLLALGKLVASVAHEINNPIGSIINFSKLVLRCLRQDPAETWEPEKWEQWLQLTVDEAERCRNIVRHLLSFSRQQSMEPRTLDLVATVNQIIRLMGHRLELGKVKLDLRLPNRSLDIWGDGTQIQQCFTNLLFNAVEAMPDGGTLTIHGGHTEDGRVFVAVADTGTGIPDDVMPMIFEPFFSTKSEVAGVGLGLSMVHGIVSGHKGRIEVDNVPGAGARFRVILPGADAGNPPSEEDAP